MANEGEMQMLELVIIICILPIMLLRGILEMRWQNLALHLGGHCEGSCKNLN